VCPMDTRVTQGSVPWRTTPSAETRAVRVT
jgi:hypothetical protein